MSHDTLTESFLQALDAILSSGLPSPAKLLRIALLRNPKASVDELVTTTGLARRTVFKYKSELQQANQQPESGAPRALPECTTCTPSAPRALQSAPRALEQRSESPPIYPPSTTSTDRNNQVDRYSNTRNNFWANLNPDYNQASQAVWWDDLGRLQVANGFRAELITTVGGEANLRQALDEAAAYVETRFVGLDLMKRVRGRITQQLRWKAEQQKREQAWKPETAEQQIARLRKIYDDGLARDGKGTVQ